MSTRNPELGLTHTDVNHLPIDEIRIRAQQRLGQLASQLTTVILPTLVNRSEMAKWHPSGFIVLPLDNIDGLQEPGDEELGTKRFHVWPKGLRRREVVHAAQTQDVNVRDGDIHTHSWLVSGLAVELDQDDPPLSAYRDNIYTMDEVPASDITEFEPVASGLLRVYSADYSILGQQTLSTDGSYARAELTQQRVVQPGRIHTILPGIAHAPAIPENELVATVVINSHRINPDGPYVYFTNVDNTHIDSHRIPVTPNDIAVISTQFAYALAG